MRNILTFLLAAGALCAVSLGKDSGRIYAGSGSRWMAAGEKTASKQ